jgi:hypothetical protein
MARASAQAENRALAGVFATAAPTVSATSHWVSLHTADPGTTGASETSGGGYARIQFSVGTPAAGACSNTGIMTFTTAGVTAVTYIGTYDAVTAGNYEVGAALASSVTAITVTMAVAACSFSCT